MRGSPKILTAVVALSAYLAASSFVYAQARFSIVRDFSGPGHPPARPIVLTEGSDGNFYGATERGGSFGRGTIFQITPGGTVTALHEFESDPSTPLSLVTASDGNLYGTTWSEVFRITAGGRLTVLHTFTVLEDPSSGVLQQGADGNFYGTTSSLVYKITSAGSFTVLHHFSANQLPGAPHFPFELVQGPDNQFYGLSYGGSLNGGTFFRISTDGAFAVLHEFGTSADDSRPTGLVLSSDGNFYGPKTNPGQILRITPLGEVTDAFTFSGGEWDGLMPADLLATPDGSIYGSASEVFGPYSLFRMAPDHSVSLIHTFNPTIEGGARIRLGFLRADGSLYGVAMAGGTEGNGSVFKLTLGGIVTVLTDFPDSVVGLDVGGLARAADGTLYGIAGGHNQPARLFSLDRDRAVTWLHTFTVSEGTVSSRLIQGTDGNLYGTTLHGSGFDSAVFRMTADGAMTILHGFTDNDPAGQFPNAIVQGADGNFYSTNWRGGEFGLGTVFRMTADGSVTVLHAFSGGSTDGARPQAGPVVARDGTVYGTTSEGGARGFGTVFKIAPDGSFSLLASVYSHDGDYSSNVMPGVTLARDGNLYGVVPHTKGLKSEAFRLTPDGVFTVLFRFGNGGYRPAEPPMEGIDGNLYGFDWPDDSNPLKHGVYKITLPDGHYESLSITGEMGVVPFGFISGGDEGYLYGVSQASFSGGYVFRLSLPMPALMIVDTPQPAQTVTQPFALSGWTLDLTPSLSPVTGVDAVHVWAYPATGGSSIFVGAAQYGFSRPDVKAIFGNRFLDTGYQLNINNLSAGTYQLVVFARRASTYEFDLARTVTITVASQPWIVFDTPATDAEVGPTFTIAGWALDTGSASGTGIDAVHLYAFPESGAPIFLGAAAYGGSRPDVGAIFGARFTNSGYSFSVGSDALASGRYRLVAFARSGVSGAFSARTRDITVRAGNPVMFVDTPQMNASVSQPFTIAGWAADTDAPTGTGVDAIHVWAFSSAGTPAFVGAASYGLARPDVGAYLGASRFTNSGYSLSATGLSSGVWQLVVFARSTVTGTFNQARVVSIAVH